MERAPVQPTQFNRTKSWVFFTSVSFVVLPPPMFWDFLHYSSTVRSSLAWSSPFPTEALSRLLPWVLGSASPLSKQQPTPLLGSSPRIVGWFWVQLRGPPNPLLAHPPTCPGFLSLLFCHGWGQPPNLYLHSSHLRALSSRKLQLFQREMIVPTLFSQYSLYILLALGHICI